MAIGDANSTTLYSRVIGSPTPHMGGGQEDAGLAAQAWYTLKPQPSAYGSCTLKPVAREASLWPIGCPEVADRARGRSKLDGGSSAHQRRSSLRGQLPVGRPRSLKHAADHVLTAAAFFAAALFAGARLRAAFAAAAVRCSVSFRSRYRSSKNATRCASDPNTFRM